MKMNAQLDASDAIVNRMVKRADVGSWRGADCVGKRNGTNAYVLEPNERVFDDFRSPGFFVRISEGHRNIDHQAVTGRFGGLPEFFDERSRFCARHVGIGAAEICRDGIRLSNCRHTWRLRARSIPCSFTTMPIISGGSVPDGSPARNPFMTSSLSAIWRTCFGETKLTASMCFTPAAVSLRRYSTFVSVGIISVRPCQASRGHSMIFTISDKMNSFVVER